MSSTTRHCQAGGLIDTFFTRKFKIMKHLVSTALLKKQKNLLWFLIVVFILLGIYTIGKTIISGDYFSLFYLLFFLIMPMQFYKDLKRIKSISYDDSALYYKSRYTDPLQKVPFENIRSITIGNFTGTFRINLFTPNKDGSHIYFRFPNMWNPFATKNRLSKIYALRDKIDACKSRMDEDYEGETQVVRLAEV